MRRILRRLLMALADLLAVIACGLLFWSIVLGEGRYRATDDKLLWAWCARWPGYEVYYDFTEEKYVGVWETIGYYPLTPWIECE